MCVSNQFSMEKDFDKWNIVKKQIHARSDTDVLYFRERDVWWASIGVNVGYEQDGKGGRGQRPVLILRKFNQHVMLVIPLSTRHKGGNKYYIPFVSPDGTPRSAIISQIRLMDIRRLTERMFMLSEDQFMLIKKATLEMIAGRFLERPPRKKRGEPEGHL